MMRRLIGAILLMTLIICTGVAVAEMEKSATSERKEAQDTSVGNKGEDAVEDADLTIMIYMCGGTLEETWSAASKDILEMMDAEPTVESIHVVLMAGGARGWRLPWISVKSTGIYQIAHGEIQLLHDTGTILNMGEPETLSTLINYSVEYLPARRYALILWNHGRGVLGGVCVDEQFNEDYLSYPELMTAIESANLEQKLSWIGFDACLMSSLELASGLSSVADFMIASQDRESELGWDYSFLREMKGDETPEETGRRIIDAFFQDPDKKGGPMTLACVDLTKAKTAAKLLGEFFAEVEKGISEETYPELSKLRGEARSFGEGVKGGEGKDIDYDLVDAEDLISRIDGPEDKKAAALQALREAVVYHRENIDHACGLTLYHPLQNKVSYVSEWADRYRSMNLIQGYTRYVQSFGTLLNEKPLVRWKDLYTKSEGRDEKGDHLFSLQLTEEEAAHVLSAQLLIVFQSAFGSELDDAVVVAGVANAEMTKDGLLHAVYDERSIYVQEENGELSGPLSFIRSADEQYDIVFASYIPTDDYGPGNGPVVRFYLDANDTSDTPEIAQVRVWDHAAGGYATRVSFDQDQYRMVSFPNLNRIYPEPEEGVLPDFYDWSLDSGIYSAYQFVLPNDWHFVVQHDQLSGDQMYAMFRITDVQQNTYCSIPVPIENDNRAEYRIVASQGNIPDTEITLTGYVDYSGEQKIYMQLDLRNTGKDAAAYYINETTLNDERELNWTMYGREIPAGEAYEREWSAPAVNLIGLGEIESISFEITRETDSDKQTERLIFRVDDLDLHRIVFPTSMGTARSFDITMDLLDIEPDGLGGFNVTTLVRNYGDEPIHTEWLIMNQFQLGGGAYQDIPSGKSKVVKYNWENGLIWIDYGLEDPDTEDIHLDYELVRNWTAKHDVNIIDRFGAIFSSKTEKRKTRYSAVWGDLNQAWEIQEAENPGAILDIQSRLYSENADAMRNLVTLVEDDRMSVKLRHLVIGDSIAIPVLELENRMDEAVIQVDLSDIQVNGEKVPDDMFNHFIVIPGCVTLGGYSIKDIDEIWQKGEKISTISFRIYVNGKALGDPVTLRFPEPIGRNGEEIIWVSSDEIDIEPAQ